MGYELIVAEKPNAAQKIAEALADKKPTKKALAKVPYYELEHNGKKIVVGCAVGHLYTLGEKDKKAWHYPIYNYEWKPTYEIDKGSHFAKAYLDALKKLAKDADEFTVATDYDIEGSVIGYNIIRFICNRKDAKRMKFSTLTKDELIESYEHAAPHLEFPVIESGITRHSLDWLWGLNLSRALTLSIKHATQRFQLLSSGRVQGPALKLLYDKEKEIQAFKSDPYWELQLLGEAKGKHLEAWHKEDKFWDKKKADDILKKTKGKDSLVDDVQTRETTSKPPVPFDLTSLQIEAYSVLGLSPQITLSIAQDLYTGGFISYPRTSSQKLPPAIGYKKILEKLKKKFSTECTYLLGKSSLTPNEGTKTDAAHPAVYPTGELPGKLEGKSAKLYELVVRRFFAVFGDNAKRETLTITLNVADEHFLAKGTRTKERGWFDLYGEFLKLEEEEFIQVSKGDKITVKDIIQHAKETQPPKRYTEASLIKELEKENLGTKATRAQILQNLYDRHYIHEKSIQVTELGVKTIETLQKYCPEILDQALTRNFEESMELITEKKKTSEQVVDDAKKFLDKTLTTFKKNEKKIGEELGQATKETQDKESYLGSCPVCKEGELHIRRGKFGVFAACNKYPGCKTTFPLPKMAKLKATEKFCEKCSYPLLLVFKAKRKPFEFCLNPDCPTKQIPEHLLKVVKHCPKCNSQLIVRKSAYGMFFACPGFPKCRHIEKIQEDPQPETQEAPESKTPKRTKKAA